MKLEKQKREEIGGKIIATSKTCMQFCHSDVLLQRPKWEQISSIPQAGSTNLCTVTK